MCYLRVNQMKLKRIGFFLTFSLSLASFSSRASIEVTSPVWVATATTIQGNNSSGSRTTVFSQRMVLLVFYAGTVSSIQSASLIDTNANWAVGEFGTNSTQVYVQFNNGRIADIAKSTTSS